MVAVLACALQQLSKPEGCIFFLSLSVSTFFLSLNASLLQEVESSMLVVLAVVLLLARDTALILVVVK
jgi:hypothetical protein